MRLLYRTLAVTGVLAVCGLGSVTLAGACALDQKPSVSVDGRLARLNGHIPTSSAQLATWTYFVFDRSYPARHPVTLTENRREVANTLTAAAMRRPWQWQFGDGHTAYGWTVRHSYAHTGKWRISVAAYDPGTKKWYSFDQVTITVRR